MSPGVVYPGILQRLCKEPLAEVTCVQLRGRGIIRLEQLDSCPKLTSLDVSWNSLKQLDGAGLEGCKELWSIDASHNQLVSFLSWTGWEIGLHEKYPRGEDQWDRVYTVHASTGSCYEVLVEAVPFEKRA